MFLKTIKYVFMYLQLCILNDNRSQALYWILRIDSGIVDRCVSPAAWNELLNLSVPQISHLKNVLAVGSYGLLETTEECLEILPVPFKHNRYKKINYINLQLNKLY